MSFIPLYMIYMEGFQDELSSRINEPEDNLFKVAYNLGRNHALLGDDNPNIDKMSVQEIIEKIYKIYSEKFGNVKN